MKEMQPESIQLNGADLTVQSDPSTLDVRGPRSPRLNRGLYRGGNIFMPEPSPEVSPPQKSEIKPVVPKAEKPKPEDVIENTLLSDEQRLAKAEEILKKPLSKEQKEAILKAHYVGFGQKGKDGIVAGVYNYTLAQLKEKAEILKNEGGFTQEQRRVLVETGIAAATTDHFDNLVVTTSGTPEEEAQIEMLLYGDRQHDPLSPDDPDLETRPDKTDIVNRINNYLPKFVERVSYGDHMSYTTLDWIARNPLAADKLITRIIMTPFVTPTVEYHLEGFYTTTNLQALISLVERVQKDAGVPEDENKGKKYRILTSAVQYYHSMNQIIGSGQIDQYGRISAYFPTEFFDVVKEIPGVADAKRLFEFGYRYVTDLSGGINNSNFLEVEQMARTWIEELNASGALVTRDEPGMPERPLQDWEVRKAVDLAKSMFNIEFRTPEKISMGELQLVSGIASSPQESATRITDWFRRMGFKFSIDEVQGGMNVMTRAKERFVTLLERKYSWLNTKNRMRLKQIGNMPIDNLELAGIFGVRGVWDGYRLDVGVLDQILVEIDGFKDDGVTPIDFAKKNISIYEYLNKTKLARIVGRGEAENILKELLSGNIITNSKKREMFRTALIRKENETDSTGRIIRPKGMLKDWDEITAADILNAAKRATTERGMENMNKILERVFSPLSENTSIAIGAVLSSGVLRHPSLYKVKEMFWERAIEYNPLIAASTLAKLSYKDEILPAGVIPAKPLDEILTAHGLTGEADPRWATIQLKLLKAHAKRMRENIEKLPISRPQGGIKDKGLDLDLSDLTDEEKAIVADIQNNCRNIKEDLSYIRFPYAVFLDDIPFADVSYKEMGPEMFRRRQGSDLFLGAEAQKAWITLVGKAAQLNPEERLKQMEALVDAVGSVWGPEGAQDYIVDALFEADCDFIRQYLWTEQMFVDAFMDTTQKPTSDAQKYGGKDGPSLNTTAMADHLKHALNHGILRTEGSGEVKIGNYTILETWEDTYNDNRKRLRASLLWIILYYFLQGVTLGPVVGVWEFGKATTKEKAA